MGATIQVEGTSLAGSADLDGKFTIPGVKVGSKIRISYIGYKPVTVEWDGKNLNITMTEDSSVLNEVVVVGFGTQKKADLTGAVSQVNMSEVIGDRPVINAAAALQGAIPGLTISGGSGPGQGKNINIRGLLSINDGSPLVLIDNVEGSIANLNPDDIETVTVLKDAASSAIYGARAAGGVVLITTKRPKNDAKFNLTYSFTQGWERSINRPEQADLLDYIQAYQDAGYSQQYWAGNGNVDTWKDLIGQYRAGTLQGVLDNGIYKANDSQYYFLKQSDVQGSILGTGAVADHNISMSGGTEKIRFRLSAGLSRENGPLVTNKDLFLRKSISSYVSADVTSWFTQELSMFYTQRKTTGYGNFGSKGFYSTRLINWYPTEGYLPGDLYGADQDYIIDTPKNNLLVGNTSTNNNSIPRIQVRSILKPLKNWTITGEYTYQQTNYAYNYYSGRITYVDIQGPAIRTSPLDPTQDYYQRQDQTTKYNALNLYTNYSLDLGKNHFTAMLGFNQESSAYSMLNAQILNQSVETVPSFGGGTGEKTVSESYSEWRVRGGFGRITYDYDGKYFATVSGRYDGSSKFPKSNRFGFFPSVTAGWRITQEKFMEGTRTWLNELKPRVSWGKIGNQAISPYGFVAQMGIGPSNVWLDGGQRVQVITPPGLVRGNYTWETVTSFNVGLDFNMFNYRLQGSFEWYRRMTTGMLAAGAEIPALVGASAPTQNVADMRNDGWELSMRWQDIVGDWKYRIGFNLYDHNSKITKFNNVSGSISVNKVGEIPLRYQIWGFQSDGYYTIDDFDLELAKQDTWVLKDGVTSVQGVTVRPGDMKYKDLDGDGIITYGASTYENSGDYKMIGNNLPRYEFGVNGGLTWKGIDFDFMLQGVGKRDYWIGSDMIFPFAAAGSDGVFRAIYYNQLDYWKPISTDPNSPDYYVAQNPNASLPRVYGGGGNAGYNARVSDKYLQNAAYMRIKNITVGYTFPQKWMKKIYVQNLRVYGSVENLHTFTSLPKGIDPENLSWTYPFYRTWSIGASITF
ncbi:MAG: TonB-dependent receptor [Paramuribaculum sp.]|nr:TonB-dependent receptor [Paramuribaculum sp.]